MIKRNVSKSKLTSRRRSERAKQKRRLTLEGLENRQLLAVLIEPPIQPAPTDLPQYTIPRNVGSVQTLQFFESENLGQMGLNDIRTTADLVPLGTAPGKQPTIDVVGTLPIVTDPVVGSGFRADIDTFAFDLRGGDILDVSTHNAAGGFTIRSATGQVLLTSSLPGGVAQFANPLQSTGNAVG